MRKKALITIGVILAIVVALNPTLSDFEAFAKMEAAPSENIKCARERYWLVFSVFRYKAITKKYNTYGDLTASYITTAQYVGVWKSFYPIPRPKDKWTKYPDE